MAIILFETYKCAIGISVTGFEKLCRKEKLLIFSYVVFSMLLVSLYQSIMISFMLIEPVTRCFKDLQELNDSNVPIYQYFGYPTEVNFREELILNKIKRDKIFSMHVPQNFDHRMVYLVPCSYAEAFVRTTKNFKGRKQLFDKIPQPLKIYLQSYKMSHEFPLRHELEMLADGLRENGIRKFWVKKLVREILDPKLKMKEKIIPKKGYSFFNMKGMIFPFMVLIVGITTGTSIFFIEQLFRIVLCFKKRNGKLEPNKKIPENDQNSNMLIKNMVEAVDTFQSAEKSRNAKMQQVEISFHD
jgi:hypothetical protein